MYADFTKDRIDMFLRDIAGQPSCDELSETSEDLLDEIMMAQMEMARHRRAAETGNFFAPRSEKLAGCARIHPADFQ